MSGGYYVPPREAAVSLINKDIPEDPEKGTKFGSNAAAASFDVHPASNSSKDDVMQDKRYALALGVLLAVLLLRELFVFLPLFGSALWQLPLTLVITIPAAAIGAVLAAMWFGPFLSYVGLMGPRGIKVVLSIVFVFYLLLSITVLTASFVPPSKESLSSTEGRIPSPSLDIERLEEGARSILLGSFISLLGITALVGMCLFGFERKYTEIASEFILSAKTFLQSRGRGLLLFACALVNAAFLAAYLFVMPMGMAMVWECKPDTQPDEQSQGTFNPYSPDYDPNNPTQGPRNEHNPTMRMSPEQAMAKLQTEFGAASAKPSCQPFLKALFPGWISGVVFGALALFLLMWVVHLLHHIVIFVTAAVTAEDMPSSSDAPVGSNAPSAGTEIGFSHVWSTAKRSLKRNIGSLCLTSLIAISFAVLTPLLRLLFFIPGLSLLAPVADPLLMVATLGVQLLLLGYVIPGMAILGTPLMPTVRRVCDLVFQHLPLVLIMEVSMGAILGTFFFMTYFVFVIAVALIGVVFAFIVPFVIPSFFLGLVASIMLMMAYYIAYHSSVCAKFIVMGLEDKLPGISNITPLVGKESGISHPSVAV